MDHRTSVVGLDVHKDSITVAVLAPGSERAVVTTVDPAPRAVERFARRAGAPDTTVFVYEAGPCGFEVYRALRGLGYACAVVAPGLIPSRPTDRVKTDRRDAENLARLCRAGLLTAVAVPTDEGEALRDPVRGREDVLTDRLRARHRMSKFLLRHGRVYRETKAWGVKHRTWLRGQRFDLEAARQTFEAYLRTLEDIDEQMRRVDQALQEAALRPPVADTVRALRCLKGVDTLAALTIAVETQDFRRFVTAPAYMAYTGLVPSEHSSGGAVHRGRITRAGNAHLRRVLVEAASCNRMGPGTSAALLERRRSCPEAIVQVARRAQDRLRRKFWKLTAAGKPHTVAVAAVARELAGFAWAIGQLVPRVA